MHGTVEDHAKCIGLLSPQHHRNQLLAWTEFDLCQPLFLNPEIETESEAPPGQTQAVDPDFAQLRMLYSRGWALLPNVLSAGKNVSPILLIDVSANTDSDRSDATTRSAIHWHYKSTFAR